MLAPLVKEKSEEYNIFEIENKGDRSGKLLALLNEKTQYKRHQPVLLELNFSSEFSGLIEDTVYYLSFRSPIAKLGNADNSDTLARVHKAYEKCKKKYPMVQLCKDSSENRSFFDLYMASALPLFSSEKKFHFLSFKELKQVFEEISSCADHVEKEAFDEEQDLSPKDLEDLEGYSLSYSNKKAPEEDIISLTKGSTRNIYRAKNEWKKDEKRGVFYLEKYFKSSKTARETPLHSIWEHNSKYPFVSLWKTGKDRILLRLHYPSVHFQKEEMTLLEKWFQYVEMDMQREGII